MIGFVQQTRGRPGSRQPALAEHFEPQRALVGLFFGIIGLFAGPVIGAVAGEFIGGKRMIDAGKAGWGSLLGNLGGMIGKLVIALAMITIFLMTVPSPI